MLVKPSLALLPTGNGDRHRVIGNKEIYTSITQIGLKKSLDPTILALSCMGSVDGSKLAWRVECKEELKRGEHCVQGIKEAQEAS